MKKTLNLGFYRDCGNRHAVNYSGTARRQAQDAMLFHLRWVWSDSHPRGTYVIHNFAYDRAKYICKTMRPKLRQQLWGAR